MKPHYFIFGLAAFAGFVTLSCNNNQPTGPLATYNLTATFTPAANASASMTPSATNTATNLSTATPTNTPTNTLTATITNTPTNTGTATATNTVTNSPTKTATNTATNTPTNSATATVTDTATRTPTNSPTATVTNTATNTPTNTPSVKTLVTFSAGVTVNGLSIDSGNNLYAAVNGRVVKITSAGVTTNVFSVPAVSDAAYDGTNFYCAIGASPYFIYRDSGGVTTSPLTLSTPLVGVAVNSSGTTLAVAYDSAGGHVDVYSLSGSTFTAQYPISAGPVAPPQALAYDASGNLYLANSTNVFKYAPGSTTGLNQAGGGTQGYLDGTATAAEFENITGIAVDASGNIYVADNGMSNSTERSIREISGGNVQTLVGTSLTGVTPNLTSPALTAPGGIAVDSSGDVYFADQQGQSIYEYVP